MSIYSFLMKDRVVKYELLYLLHFPFIHDPLKRYSIELYLNSKRKLQRERKSSETRKSSRSTIELADLDTNEISVEMTENDHELQKILGLPEEHKLIKWYKIISTVYLTYGLIRYIVLSDIVQYLRPNSNPDCYLLGRLILFRPMYKLLISIICFYHLLWRVDVIFFTKQFKLNFVLFMVQDDDEIEKLYRQNQSFKTIKNKNKHQTATAYEEYLRTIMFYPVKYATRVRFRLRPNRTSEVRKQLKSYSAKIIIAFIVQMSIYSVFLLIIVVYYSLNQIVYVKTYPNCDSELDELYRTGKLKPFTLFMAPHHVVSIVFHYIENAIIWFSTGCGIFAVFTVFYLLNLDLLIYWKSVYEQLEDSVLQYQRKYAIIRNLQVELGVGDNLLESWKEKPIWSGLHLRNLYYNDNTHEIQTLIRDFFEQIRLVDSFVSHVISIYVIVWFGDYMSIGYFYLVYPDERDYQQANVISTYFILVAICPVVVYMFTLYHKTKRMHPLICSLMAFDTSKYKRNYTKILDYYTSYNKNTYTFLGLNPFTPAKFLALMGWTYSCSILIEGLYENIANKNYRIDL